MVLFLDIDEIYSCGWCAAYSGCMATAHYACSPVLSFACGRRAVGDGEAAAAAAAQLSVCTTYIFMCNARVQPANDDAQNILCD
jgi:hypothetical protein